MNINRLSQTVRLLTLAIAGWSVLPGDVKAAQTFFLSNYFDGSIVDLTDDGIQNYTAGTALGDGPTWTELSVEYNPENFATNERRGYWLFDLDGFTTANGIVNAGQVQTSTLQWTENVVNTGPVIELWSWKNVQDPNNITFPGKPTNPVSTNISTGISTPGAWARSLVVTPWVSDALIDWENLVPGAGYIGFVAFDNTPAGDGRYAIQTNDANSGTGAGPRLQLSVVPALTGNGPTGVTVDENNADVLIDLPQYFSPTTGLSFAVSSNSNPGLVTASIAGNQLQLSFALNQNGSATVSFTASDGQTVDDVTDTIIVTVNPVNSPPTVNALSADSGTEDLSQVYTHGELLSLIGAADPDNLLTELFVSIPSVTNGTLGLGGGSGGDGTIFTFTPAPDFFGDMFFQYQVSDGLGGVSNTGTATLAIAPVNDLPVGRPIITGTIEEDQTLTADTSGISDVEGIGPFSLQWQRSPPPCTGPCVAVLEDIPGANGPSYTLGDDDVDRLIAHKVTYTDGQGTPETVNSVLVGPVINVNDAPTVRDPAQSFTTEDNIFTWSHADLLGVINAQDVDDPPENLTITLSNFANGTVTLSGGTGGDGTLFTVTPDPNFVGLMTFDHQVTDAAGASSAVGQSIIEFSPVNDPPEQVLGPDPLFLAVGAPATVVDASPFFNDVDGDPLEYSVSLSVPGIVEFTQEGSVFAITALSTDGGPIPDFGATDFLITAADPSGAEATANIKITTDFLGEATLLQAVTDAESGAIAIATRITGEPGASAQIVELLSSDSCTLGVLGEGGEAVETASFPIGEFPESGETFLAVIIPDVGPVPTYMAARISSNYQEVLELKGELSPCIVAGADNDSWVRALEVPLSPADAAGDTALQAEGRARDSKTQSEHSELTAEVVGYLDREGISRWYKFFIQPGANVTVEVSDLPADYDVLLFKDIAQAFTELQGDNDVEGLNNLSAEFAPSVFSPSVFSPSVFSPSVFSPDAYAPSVFSPSVFSPSVFSPSVFSPSVFSPSVFSPSVFSPSAFSPSVFSPDATAPSVFSPEDFGNAQIRSLIGVSANQGTGGEFILADTWNNTGSFYVRVVGKNGAYDLEQPFNMRVSIDGVNCAGVVPVAAATPAPAGDYETIILWDSARVAADAAETPSEFEALGDNLAALAMRDEVNGVVVDLSEIAHIQTLHEQATEQSSCPFAENLVAHAIKDLITSYRQANNAMRYVVLVGSDAHIPFFRYPDQALLGPEQNYEPPMGQGTQSESALRLNYILGQDEYGSSNSLSLRDGDFPLPDLAVGRLVESAAEMNTMLAAYLSTAAGVIDDPDSTLVTGYDFLVDTAEAVNNELVLGAGAVRHDTLITAADISPDDPRSWTADDLRRELLEEGEDIVFLAGHFSANSTLAADYTTTALTTELAAASPDLMNSIVFSAGCHSGYNLVDGEAVPGVSLLLDWTQAFAQKGATLIAGTGYQYGDTDFIEYSERLYVQFARELRRGTGPVSVGEALVRAKQQYLATTPDIRGLHHKSLLISTVFGLPMLSVDMPGERLVDPPEFPGIATSVVDSDPGALLELEFADIELVFDEPNDGELIEETVELYNLEDPGSPLLATYLRGRDGVVTNPAEPAIPLVARNVTPENTALSLRGVGFRGGSWRERIVLPLTGAPTTELRGVHTPFVSPVYFPMRLFTANYFDALSGGGSTSLLVTPVQHRVQTVGDQDATLRQFDDLSLRLFYSGNTQTYGSNIPALSGPPTFSDVRATISGDDILFEANVVGDPAAGIQAVWVTYADPLAASGVWESIDLLQDPVDSTLWTGALINGAIDFELIDFMLQAVSGNGLVTFSDNFGAYYQLEGVTVPGEEPIDPYPTTLSYAPATPTSGTYGTQVTINAELACAEVPEEFDPNPGATVIFTIGGTGRVATTNEAGEVSVNLPLNSLPDNYVLTASYAGSEDCTAASAELDFTIEKAATELTLQKGEQAVRVEGVDPGISAELKDASGTPLLQRTVYFTLEGGPRGTMTLPVITDNTGTARLGELALPAREYQVTARFLGSIPTGDGNFLELSDAVYLASEDDDSFDLINSPDCPNRKFEPKGKKTNPGEKFVIEGFCYLQKDTRGKVEIAEGTVVVGPEVTVYKKIIQSGSGSILVEEGGEVRGEMTEQGPGGVTIRGLAHQNVLEEDEGGILIERSGGAAIDLVESGLGDVEISGLVQGDVMESDEGDLIVTQLGIVDGTAEETGAGQLKIDGAVGAAVQD